MPRTFVPTNPPTTYPEAIVTKISRNFNIRTITYETSHKEGAFFFSYNDATRYDIKIPDTFKMSNFQNEQLDEVLSKRFKGNFSMGGVNFWPEIKKIDKSFNEITQKFKFVVLIFTNVVFDTSQNYADFPFDNMFDWLDVTLKIADKYKDVLFIVRAHPAEELKGKYSRESVSSWMRYNGWLKKKNIRFFSPKQFVNSYELILKSKFILAYNSTIALESAILGVPAIVGGRARYSNSGAVVSISSREDFINTLNRYLCENEFSEKDEQKELARRYYYYSYFNTNLDLSKFLGKNSVRAGFKIDKIDELQAQNSKEIDILLNAIVNGQKLQYD